MNANFLLILFIFFGEYSFAQSKIDNSKIESLCFELHNTYRDTLHKRNVSNNCKKASDYQVDYLFKNNLTTHDNPNKGYEEPDDRYGKFNTDSIKIKNTESIKGWRKFAKTDCSGEILTMGSGFVYKKDSLLEKNIAKQIITNFLNSPHHKVSMTINNYNTINEIGYFSVRTRILEETEDTVEVYFICVAIFGSEMYRNPEWIVK